MIQEVDLLYLHEEGPKHSFLTHIANLLMLELPLVLKKEAQHPEDHCSPESLTLKPVRERKISKKTKIQGGLHHTFPFAKINE